MNVRLIISVMIWFGGYALTASEYDNELLRFDFETEIRAMRLVDSQLDTRQVATDLKLMLPIYPPQLTPQQISLKIEDEVYKSLEAQYSKAQYEKIKQQADETFRMYKPGDHISIMRQYGGQQLEASGLLEVVSKDIVKISSLPIPKLDIAKKDLARLYWAEHEEAIKKYVRMETRKFDDARIEFEKKERQRLTHAIWTDAGYRRLKKSNTWIPNVELFYKKLDLLRRQKIAEVLPGIKEEVYKENKYVYDEQQQSWVPHSVVALAAAQKASAESGGLLGKMKAFLKTKTVVEAPTAEEFAELETSGDEAAAAATPTESSPNTPATDGQPATSEPAKQEDLWSEEAAPPTKGAPSPSEPNKSEATQTPAPKSSGGLYDE